MNPSEETDRQFMQIALEQCRLGIKSGQAPFGACIVEAGELVAAAHNQVYLHTDITAHAEVQCIRDACYKTGRIHLPDATLYSTTEPCPMCFSAVHWMRIGRIVYAARIEDARYYGFNEMQINNDVLASIISSPIEITMDFMRDDALALYELWREGSGKPY